MLLQLCLYYLFIANKQLCFGNALLDQYAFTFYVKVCFLYKFLLCIFLQIRNYKKTLQHQYQVLVCINNILVNLTCTYVCMCVCRFMQFNNHVIKYSNYYCCSASTESPRIRSSPLHRQMPTKLDR